jgi:hypothetical protein
MTINFEDSMSKRTDVEVFKIATQTESGFELLAIEAAQKELAKRNLSAEQISALHSEIEQEQTRNLDKANEPLDYQQRILTMFIPGIVVIFLWGVYKREGYHRKSKDLIWWTIYGFFFYIGIFSLIGTIKSLFIVFMQSVL